MNQLIKCWHRSLVLAFAFLLTGWTAAHGLSGLNACQIEADYDLRSTEPVTVDLQLMCNGQPAPSVTWDLGDGTYLVGNPITHTYITADAFTVKANAGNRRSVVDTVIRVPGFLLLDDLEDPVASLDYWQITPGSVAASTFSSYLATRQENGFSNTEFKLQIGLDDGTTDSNNGYDGMIIPPTGGGGQDPFANAARYPQGRIELDLRTEMSWSKLGAASSAIHFTVLDIFGLDARVVARAGSNQEVLLRIETETNQSPWISLGQGHLDSRFSVTLTPTSLSSILELNWWRQDGSQTSSTSLWLPVNSEVIGLGTRKPRILMEDGSSPPYIAFGFVYLDNFECTQYLDD